MRILVVHNCLAAQGGAERYIREISKSLSAEGFELTFLTAKGQTPNWATSPIYTISSSAGWRSGRRVLPQLRQVLAAARPELIFIHSLQDFFSPLLLRALIRSAPSVLFVHDVRLVCPNEKKILLESDSVCAQPAGLACLRGNCCRLKNESTLEAWNKSAYVFWRLRVCRKVGRMIAPSGYIAHELSRNGIKPEKIVIVPYFTERRPVPKPPEPKGGLLWVGRFDGSKGFEAFAQMLASLPNPSCPAVVAGGGEGLGEARKLIAELGLTDRVSFVGHLNDRELDGWYSWARVVVVTSMLAESFCMVGIEAMAHGRPVVAFDVGGIPEWMADGTTGFTVRRGDPQALAQAVNRLLSEPALARKLGEAGHAVVDVKFRLSNVLPKLLQVFELTRSEWAAG